MFVLFVAARQRVTVYTDILWGGGSRGGGTMPEKGKGNVADKDGDGFDKGDAVDIAGKVLPYPFNLPFEFELV